MESTQRLPASLTPLESALHGLLQRLAAVPPVEVPLAEALGCIAADMPDLAAFPPTDIAAADGWALRARDLVGASSYTPLPLAKPPVWVEAGDAMPDGCDCVLDSDAVDLSGPMVQVLADAIPGQGVRRIGGDVAAGSFVALGRRIRPLDLLAMRAAGLKAAIVRRPRLRIVNIPATSGEAMTAELISANARAEGAEVMVTGASSRDASGIAAALDPDGCDLLITIGGSGVGRSDAAVTALAERGQVEAHGIAVQPGRTTAVGLIATTSVIALPGAPDQALAAWWMLALPALDRLSGRLPRQTVTLPLVRKIASSVGIAEIALLARNESGWMPLAVGDLPIEIMARADGWVAIPGGSEGHAAGTAVNAYLLRD
ncbi:MAG: molybdopterin-binding protein [Bradyrhizobium sp.]